MTGTHIVILAAIGSVFSIVVLRMWIDYRLELAEVEGEKFPESQP
jgi:hypothetical protein